MPRGRELQRMTSALQLMPGETGSVVSAATNRARPRHGPHPSCLWLLIGFLAIWSRRGGAKTGFSTFRPSFSRSWTSTVSNATAVLIPTGGCNLTGDKTRYFSMAYDNLLGRSRSYRQHDMATGDMLPDEAAKGKPLVHFFWLLRTPTAVNRPLMTGTFASRLPDYLEQDHVGRPVPLEDKQRIYAWLDANVPYYGTYAHSRPAAPGRRDLCYDAGTGKPSEMVRARLPGCLQPSLCRMSRQAGRYDRLGRALRLDQLQQPRTQPGPDGTPP